ncbi:hypothetical protein BRADI_3g15306v3 [Brachypodium distachyon]|uniref:Uncharacterized protein n=1 Tax=Brachypodium distachyon TaxID=15368 RepID=A0A2K2CXA6_BRADI|nr:hypothetical protein BRADI_3g15306v3 [Brachypodium distachyon]
MAQLLSPHPDLDHRSGIAAHRGGPGAGPSRWASPPGPIPLVGRGLGPPRLPQRGKRLVLRSWSSPDPFRGSSLGFIYVSPEILSSWSQINKEVLDNKVSYIEDANVVLTHQETSLKERLSGLQETNKAPLEQDGKSCEEKHVAYRDCSYVVGHFQNEWPHEPEPVGIILSKMHESCFGGVARLLQHRGCKKGMGAMDPKPPTLEDVEKDRTVQGGPRGFSLFELLLFSKNCNVLLQKVVAELFQVKVEF